MIAPLDALLFIIVLCACVHVCVRVYVRACGQQYLQYSQSVKTLDGNVQKGQGYLEKDEFEINEVKTEVMFSSRVATKTRINIVDIREEKLNQVTEFEYLGSVT